LEKNVWKDEKNFDHFTLIPAIAAIPFGIAYGGGIREIGST